MLEERKAKVREPVTKNKLEVTDVLFTDACDGDGGGPLV